MFPVTDIILAGLFLLIVVLASIKGLLKTVLDLAAMVGAFVCAKIASPFASAAIYESLVKPRVITSLENTYGSLSAAVTNEASAVVDSLSFLPRSVLEYVRNRGIMDTDAVNNALQSTVGTAAELETKVISPVMTNVINAIIFIIILIFLIFLFRLIALIAVKAMKKSKTLKASDHVFGALFGIVKGLAAVFLAVYVLRFVGGLNETVASFNEASPVYAFFEQITF